MGSGDEMDGGDGLEMCSGDEMGGNGEEDPDILVGNWSLGNTPMERLSTCSLGAVVVIVIFSIRLMYAAILFLVMVCTFQV